MYTVRLESVPLQELMKYEGLQEGIITGLVELLSPLLDDPNSKPVVSDTPLPQNLQQASAAKILCVLCYDNLDVASMSPLSFSYSCINILLTKTTAAQNGVAISYHKVRGLYFQAVVFVRSIYELLASKRCNKASIGAI